jgi:hypothetical protein
MSARFITYVIIGVAFGFTQLWFVYWVVKIFKEKQRLVTARRAGGQGAAAAAPAKAATAPSAPAEDAGRGEKRVPNHPADAGTRGPGQA